MLRHARADARGNLVAARFAKGASSTATPGGVYSGAAKYDVRNPSERVLIGLRQRGNDVACPQNRL